MRPNKWIVVFIFVVVCCVNIFFFNGDRTNGDRDCFLKRRQLPAEAKRNTGPIVNHAPLSEIAVDPSACLQPTKWGSGETAWDVCLDDVVPNSCVVYSYGLGMAWEFENTAEASGCVVHGFDPTGRNWREGSYVGGGSHINYEKNFASANKKFHNWGLGSLPSRVYPPGTVPQEWPGLDYMRDSNSEAWEMKSVTQAMTELGHREGGVSILKIDVEGSEWAAVTEFLVSNEETIKQGRFPQVMLEFHWNPHTRVMNACNQAVLTRFKELGYVVWTRTPNPTDTCCMDVSFVWRGT